MTREQFLQSIETPMTSPAEESFNETITSELLHTSTPLYPTQSEETSLPTQNNNDPMPPSPEESMEEAKPMPTPQVALGEVWRTLEALKAQQRRANQERKALAIEVHNLANKTQALERHLCRRLSANLNRNSIVTANANPNGISIGYSNGAAIGYPSGATSGYPSGAAYGYPNGTTYRYPNGTTYEYSNAPSNDSSNWAPNSIQNDRRVQRPPYHLGHPVSYQGNYQAQPFKPIWESSGWANQQGVHHTQ
ncbi:hypothetical protein MMC25_006248 [Agyrium rufum]|nr:hypothetical protein [Agyrium rufum]